MELTVGRLASELGGVVEGETDTPISGGATLEEATAGDLAYVESRRHLVAAATTAAGCLLAAAGLDLGKRTVIRVAEPKLAFARALALLCPRRQPPPGVHPSAVVDPSARLGNGVHVAPLAVIAADVVLGERVVVGAGAVVGEGVRIGADTVLRPRVVVYPSVEIGARVLVHAGAVLGSDGFGFVKGPEGLVKFPQVGRLVVEDDVEVGANTTIDRGALGTTVIGRGTKIDNLVQIAHNVVLGRDCALSAQTGIAGSSRIGDGVTFGGQVGIGDHVRIEDGVSLGGQAGVPSGKVVRRGQVVWGTPAKPLAEVKKQLAHLAIASRLRDELRQLREEIARLTAGQDASGDDDRRR